MPTKTPAKKKNVKVTQLDPLKPIRAQLRAMNAKLNVCMSRAETIVRHCDSIYAEVGKLHSLNDEAISDAYERGRKSAPPAPEPEVKEPHKFKEGDWVVCDSFYRDERRAEEEAKARQLRIQQLKKELAELEANAEP